MNIQNELQKIHTQYGTSEMANYQIQLLFEKVIAEHEAGQWKEYPKEKPGKIKSYIVTCYDHSVCEMFWAGNGHVDWRIVIAFRELPAPYQPEEGGEQ